MKLEELVQTVTFILCLITCGVLLPMALVLILFTIIAFWRLSKPASYLMVPYILWVSFAIVLNASLWHLNR